MQKRIQPRAVGLAYRQLILYRRHLDRKFEVFFWPLIDALLFGAIGTYAQRSGSSSTLSLMMVGFVMAQVVWQSHIHLSKFAMQETWDHNVLYMMTRPLRASDLMLAGIGLAAGIAVLAAVFISGVAAVVFGLNLFHLPLGVAALVPVLMVLGWSTGIFAISLVLRLGQKAENFVWAMFGIIGPLSGSIVPVHSLPAVVRPLALALPTTYAYEAGRAIVFGDGFPVRTYLIAAFGAISLFGLAVLVLRHSVSQFRERGFISRYV